MLHLLDGTYELFRAYFGAPPRTAPDGGEVGAVHGLMASVISLLREPEVTHIGVAFDTVIRSFRNNLFSGYKTGEGVPPDLLAQFPLAELALESLGLKVWRMVEFEADDAMASATHRWKDEVSQVVIFSPDKDLTQCVESDRVVTFNRKDQKRFAEDDVIAKFGVLPRSIPDYLALVGDSADGIPGLAGWGAKSTSTVLARYLHIEEIPSSHEDWDVEVRGAAGLARTLAERMDEALLFRTLTTLRTDAPVGERLDELEWQGVPRAEFIRLCDELGFGDIRERPWRS